MLGIDVNVQSRYGLVVAALVAATGCAKGCSCSPLAKADDPRAFIPADSAVVLEADLGEVGNHAVFRQIVVGLWEEKSCLVPLVLEQTSSLLLSMQDGRPDGRTLPRGVIVTAGQDPEAVLECLSAELFPDAGEPEQEEYRGVKHWGYPERMPVRIGVVNPSMLLVGDRDGIHRMVDTFLDQMPSLARSRKFDVVRGKLPAEAQIRLVALPGPQMRESARTRLEKPWSVLLDSGMVALGLVFTESGLSVRGVSRMDGDPEAAARAVRGVSRMDGDPEAAARAGNGSLQWVRKNKIAAILGVTALLGETRFDVSGKDVVLEGRAEEKVIEHFVKGAGQFVEIGL
jgi:hypothetical protein